MFTSKGYDYRYGGSMWLGRLSHNNIGGKCDWNLYAKLTTEVRGAAAVIWDVGLQLKAHFAPCRWRTGPTTFCWFKGKTFPGLVRIA